MAFQVGIWYTTNMIDRDLLRQNPDVIKESLIKRGGEPKLVDQFVVLDQQWRDLSSQVEPVRATKNKFSRDGKPTPALLKKTKALDKELSVLEKKLKEVEIAAKAALLALPNIVANDVPVGAGESANIVVKQVGRVRLTTGQPHHVLMSNLGWLDLTTAAEFSGSRFRYLKGSAVWAHLSIVGEAMKMAVHHGFTPVIPPIMTRPETLEKAGYLPFLHDDFFKIERDNLLLIGTSEPTLLALAAGKVLEEKDLPFRLVGFSTCLRREVGSYGKDVEGMFRQHQFDKVELVSFTTPEQSNSEHNFLVSLEEKFTKQLGLPYQTVVSGSGDLGPTAAKKFDVEVWFPSQGRYRESHSASNCLDFQARRFNIKYRDKNGQEQFTHTLNATLATERLLLSYIENHQHSDGSVDLPRRWRV